MIEFAPKKVSEFVRGYQKRVLGIFLVILLCLNVLIYSLYVFIPMKNHSEPVSEKTTIDQETLSKVLEDVSEREENLSRVNRVRYYDPFK